MYSIFRPISAFKRLSLVLLVASSAVACAEEESRPGAYVADTTEQANPEPIDPCAVPSEGCKCPEPGLVADCGQVTVKVDNYETCFEGSRLCQSDGSWGACVSDQTIVDLSN